MANDGIQLCYLATLVVAVVLVVWGFMDLLKNRKPDESSQTVVISRQIRGLALILLANVALLLGGAVCFGISGGLGGVAKLVGKASRV